MNDTTIGQESLLHYGLDELLMDKSLSDVLVTETHPNLKYTPSLGGWFKWNSSFWELDPTAINQAVSSIGNRLLFDAGRVDTKTDSDRLHKRGWTLQKRAAVQDIVWWANQDSRIRRDPAEWDSNPYLFNTYSGTVDLRTGELLPHNRNDLITKIAPVEYDPTATAPEWDRFLARVQPNQDVRSYLQKAIGQALSGTTEEQALYVNWGIGANGKSTFFDTILTLMGDYAGGLDTAVLMESNRAGGADPKILALRGKRLVIASETEKGHRLNESLIKKMTGDKYLSGRYLYSNHVVSFTREFKLFMHVNDRPEITGSGYSIWRRQRLVPWDVTIQKSEQDPELLTKLTSELPGILNWCLEGYRLYQKEGLEPPATVLEATNQYKHDMNKVAQFIADECTTNMPGSGIHESLHVTKDNLYQAYQTWCKDNGVYPEKKKTVGERLVELGYDPHQTAQVNGKKARVWRGIGLLAE